MKLTPHEQKILKIIEQHPKIIDSPEERNLIAKQNGLTEKTLRNRIAEFRKRGFIDLDKKNTKSEQDSLITDNDEINVKEIWNILKHKKKLVVKFALISTTIGLTYSLIATIYFESNISLYPAGELSQSGGILGDFQGLAKSFGMGGLSSAPTYNIPDIIRSRRLKKDIVLKDWKSQKYPKGSNLITYWEIDKIKMFSPMKIIRSILPSGSQNLNKLDLYTYESILKLDDLISVKEEISGLITVRVQMEDPILASNIANYIAEYVKNFISIEQKREANRNIIFVQKQMEEAKLKTENSEDKLTKFRKNNPLRLDTPTTEMIRERLESRVEENRTVYITIRQQLEIAKIDEAKEKLLINILDLAEPAVKKSRPKRTLIVVLSFFAGCMLSVPFALFSDRKD